MVRRVELVIVVPMNSSHISPHTLSLTNLAAVLLACTAACASPTADSTDVSADALSSSKAASGGLARLVLKDVSPSKAIEGTDATLRLVAGTIEIETSGRSFSAPITQTYSDFCNVVTTAAFEDHRDVDGARTSIKITDWSHANTSSVACKTGNTGFSVSLDVQPAGNSLAKAVAAHFHATELRTRPSYSCKSADANGYRVEVWTKPGGTALTEARVFLGTELADLLRTSRAVEAEAPVGADIPRTFAAFKNIGIADGGFSVSLSQGGFAGLTQASLSELTFFGTTDHGTLICTQ
jgi:hypothetical protein